MKYQTDEQLMEIFQNNNNGQGSIAFDHLYQRYAKTMVNYFYYALQKDNKKAQDFLHDLFLKILESKNKFDCKQTFKPWIYRIAINMCNNEYRRTAIHQKFEEHVKASNHFVYYENNDEKNLWS